MALYSEILHPDGTVLKQLQPPPRGPREQEFYNKATYCTVKSSGNDSTMLSLPKASRVLSSSLKTPTPMQLKLNIIPDCANTYLKLEDVTRKFNKPCIMDVKIGQKSYDPYASAEKIQQQVSKYPLMEEIGFLVLGMRSTGNLPVDTEQTHNKLWQVYHVSSDSYETQNQHYGRSLTKETVKDGISKFFHSGYCLRKDVVAASIQKVEKILEWFEGQTQLNFYASSLLFVYEGSYQVTTVRLSDVTLAEKRRVPKSLLSGGDVLEYNNNIHVLKSTENGKIEASVSKDLSKFYALHKKACSKRHHSQLSLKVENSEQDNAWKTSTCITQEHLNGNVLPQLEKVFYHMPAETKESANVEVRMIDFAHLLESTDWNHKQDRWTSLLRDCSALEPLAVPPLVPVELWLSRPGLQTLQVTGPGPGSTTGLRAWQGGRVEALSGELAWPGRGVGDGGGGGTGKGKVGQRGLERALTLAGLVEEKDGLLVYF
ncbi:hypothetical protein IHE44_0007639 [Lamprotornis superbus]|uniref:Kinase n=1 Tax=Lamprotornis superbus TaxID=245042 RepID=A0A835NDT6_9PASS|nr:hypothetical protein IHE44_0007639 [Lamprotornis superbus]